MSALAVRESLVVSPHLWPMKRIGDLGEVVTGKTPSTANRAYYNGKYLFVTPSDLDYLHYYCKETEGTVTELAREKHKNQFIPKDSVMFTCIGNTIGKCALSSIECLTNQQINSVVPNSDNDGKFIYYLLNWQKDLVRGIGLGGGAATPIINKTTFSNIKLPIPPLPTQRRIAEVLSAYDDLIENNRRRIKLLEQAAKLLYREWFVHLRFPGHDTTPITNGLPQGWSKQTLGDRITLHYGKALKAEVRQDGEIPVYGSSGIVGTHDKAIVKGPAMIVGRKGNVGSVFWSATDFYPIDTVYYVSSEESSYYLFHTLQSMTFISSDAAVPGLNRNFAYSKPLFLPAAPILEKFENAVNPIYSQIRTLEIQNKKLAEARDILLPRLMNGEVAV